MFRRRLLERVLLTSNNGIRYYHYVVVGLWLILVVFAAKYFMQQRAIDFDPKGLLVDVENNVLLATILASNRIQKSPKNTLYHLYTEDCGCNKVTDSHMNSVFSLAKENSFTVEHILITPDIRAYVPSSPAVLATDEQGELLYFGPYGEGAACSKSNGIIDVVLNNFFQGFKFSAIHSQATGCYCNLS